MSVSPESRILQEPSFAGVASASGADIAKWLGAPADEAPMGYWRKPDGHVILAHYGENGTEKKLDRGFVRLGMQYGQYSSSAMADLKDPFYGILARGGLKEFPAEQIKLLGWHRPADRNSKRSHRLVSELVERAMNAGLSRDEALVEVMPQLEGHDLTDYTCAACPGRWFPHKAAALNHEAVMHKDAVQSRSIGEAVAHAQTGNGGGGTSDAGMDALLQMVATQGELIAGLQAQLAAQAAPKKGARKGADETEAAPETE